MRSKYKVKFNLKNLIIPIKYKKIFIICTKAFKKEYQSLNKAKKQNT